MEDNPYVHSKERKEYPSLCTQCGGAVIDGLTEFVYEDRGVGTRIVRGVPVGICRSCGERHLREEVVAENERLFHGPPRGDSGVGLSG